VRFLPSFLIFFSTDALFRQLRSTSIALKVSSTACASSLASRKPTSLKRRLNTTLNLLSRASLTRSFLFYTSLACTYSRNYSQDLFSASQRPLLWRERARERGRKGKDENENSISRLPIGATLLVLTALRRRKPDFGSFEDDVVKFD
jgi:hypothetical protein